MLKELNQRAPMLLRTSIVAVDVMKDSSEEVRGQGLGSGRGAQGEGRGARGEV